MFLSIFLSLLVATAAAIIGLAWWGGQRFARRGEEVARSLMAQSEPVARRPGELEGLPAPVRRYLEQALPPAGGEPRLARATVRGQMRLSAARPWQPWQGSQAWSLNPPGMVWNARLRMSRLMVVFARDALELGRGKLLVSLWGWLTLARAEDAPELDQGSLQRWLAEAPFFPLALLPGEHLSWEEINETSARAVVRLGGVEAEGVFRFSRRGLPLSFYTPARWQQRADKSFAATPWQARFGRWRRMEGCLVPTWGQASWLPPEGDYAYIRLEVEKMELV
ncbi:MAG: hypothetical protein KQH53_18220 [Desulfarculaceae bacterium]|nr:hypothetical protein [Desulfarculaceae bacterium]